MQNKINQRIAAWKSAGRMWTGPMYAETILYDDVVSNSIVNILMHITVPTKYYRRSSGSRNTRSGRRAGSFISGLDSARP